MDAALKPLANALYGFISELKEQRDVCVAHNGTTAIHTAGSTLQVFRMYRRDADVVTYMRKTVAAMPEWHTCPLWKWEGSDWELVEKQVRARMRKHNKLLPIITRGVEWHGQPVLVHAYKFETDTHMKLELVLPSKQAAYPEFSLKMLSLAVQCHDHLIPDFLAQPLAPYRAHETRFQTLTEYLDAKLPKDLYTLCCFPQTNGNAP